MTNELDLKLALLKEYENKLKALSEEKEKVRAEVFEILKKENLGQYKNEIATISKVERKTITYVREPELIIKELNKKKLVKYITTVPEVVIPEHKELNSQFEKDIKEGVLNIEGVQVKVSESPMIRFS